MQVASYFTVAFVNHDIILEECRDTTDEGQPRKPRANSWNVNLRSLVNIAATLWSDLFAYMAFDTGSDVAPQKKSYCNGWKGCARLDGFKDGFPTRR